MPVMYTLRELSLITLGESSAVAESPLAWYSENRGSRSESAELLPKASNSSE